MPLPQPTPQLPHALQAPVQFTGQGCVLHAVRLTVPLANAHAAPPFAAGVVTKNVWAQMPPLQLALQGVGVLQLPTQLTGQACNCKRKCSMAKCWLAACQLASLVLLTGMGGPAGLRHTANHCIAQCQRQPEAKLYVHRLHCQLKQLRNAVLASPPQYTHTIPVCYTSGWPLCH